MITRIFSGEVVPFYTWDELNKTEKDEIISHRPAHRRQLCRNYLWGRRKRGVWIWIQPISTFVGLCGARKGTIGF